VGYSTCLIKKVYGPVTGDFCRDAMSS